MKVSSLLSNGLQYIGKRTVIREGNRWKIYLPMDFEDLWRELEGKKVDFYIRVKEQ